MNNRGSSTAGGGIGFCGLLTIVFIILKILGFIQWSWLWVLSPLWIPFAVIFAIVVIVKLLAEFGKIISDINDPYN